LFISSARTCIPDTEIQIEAINAMHPSSAIQQENNKQHYSAAFYNISMFLEIKKASRLILRSKGCRDLIVFN
jgi:hypothetical protein